MKRLFKQAIFFSLTTGLMMNTSYAATSYPAQLLFGDTHLHTNLSGDARGYGVKLSPEDAYKVARGETIASSTGISVTLHQPLDFLVIADHAEGYGMMQKLFNRDPELISDPQLAKWAEMLNQDKRSAFTAVRQMIVAQGNGQLPKAITDNPEAFGKLWQDYITITEKYNEPGKFTAMYGYEWTGMYKGNNLHRVVVFRDGATIVRKTLPVDSNKTAHDPRQLWQALAEYEKSTGGQVLAIPHNSNLSGGMMFVPEEVNTIATATERVKWEPMVEITQIKGDSETHPYLSPDDQYADFETWDVGNLALTQATTIGSLRGSYVRSALKMGLTLQQAQGINPFKVGFVGASDSHTGIPVTTEANFMGKHSMMEPSPTRMQRPVSRSMDLKLVNKGTTMAASGLTAVWAHANNRESIFDALERREAYATTGPRIAVRMFIGQDFPDDLFAQQDWVAKSYQLGKPMGSTIANLSSAPKLALFAQQDPNDGALAKIQIIKGWVDAQGQTQEVVIDAVSSPTKEGSATLQAIWQDPNWQANQASFYYARVLQVPTQRWTAFDAKRFNVAVPDGAPTTIVERAYGSPIWYEAN